MKTEHEILEALSKAEEDFNYATLMLQDAKKKAVQAEDKLIEAKLNLEKAREDKRVFYNTIPHVQPTLREQEIKKFREEHPELCEMAKQRDLEKTEKQ